MDEDTRKVDQKLEGVAGASACDLLPRGTVPDESWADGPKSGPSDAPALVREFRPTKKRVVQVMAQDEFGNQIPVNFFLESEPEDDDRFMVRRVDS